MHVGEAALDHQAAQLWHLRRREHTSDGAEGIAEDADASNIHIATRTQVVQHCGDILRLARAIGDELARAFTVASEIEQQRAIAAARMELRHLRDPLAAIVIDAMTADQGAAVVRGEIPGGKLTSWAGDA